MSKKNFYLKNYFIRDENGLTKEQAKQRKEQLECLLENPPPYEQDEFAIVGTFSVMFIITAIILIAFKTYTLIYM